MGKLVSDTCYLWYIGVAKCGLLEPCYHDAVSLTTWLAKGCISFASYCIICRKSLPRYTYKTYVPYEEIEKGISPSILN